jgi:hypothetical protein
MYGSNDSWGGYPDERDAMSGVGDYVAMAGLMYVPDLAPVGSGAAGTYYPRDTTQDAQALNYLGFFPDPLLLEHVGTTGSQAGDMNEGAGAWSQPFQQAVRDFQLFMNLGADGWIGPNTRRVLGEQVAAKNLREPIPVPVIPPAPIPVPPSPLPIPPAPIPVPPSPLPLPPGPLPVPPAPQPAPAQAKTDDKTMRYIGIGVGVLALLGLGAYALSDD